MQAVCTTAFVKDRESAKPSFCWPGKIPRQVPVLKFGTQRSRVDGE